MVIRKWVSSLSLSLHLPVFSLCYLKWDSLNRQKTFRITNTLTSLPHFHLYLFLLPSSFWPFSLPFFLQTISCYLLLRSSCFYRSSFFSSSSVLLLHFLFVLFSFYHFVSYIHISSHFLFILYFLFIVSFISFFSVYFTLYLLPFLWFPFNFCFMLHDFPFPFYFVTSLSFLLPSCTTSDVFLCPSSFSPSFLCVYPHLIFVVALLIFFPRLYFFLLPIGSPFLFISVFLPSLSLCSALLR